MRRCREIDGEVGYLWTVAATCLLATIGRKSREERMIGIIFKQIGKCNAIIALKVGSPAHPAWYYNIQDDLRVRIQIKGEKFAGLALVAGGLSGKNSGQLR